VGSQPTIPVFKQAKTFHALECAANVIGFIKYYDNQILDFMTYAYPTWELEADIYLLKLHSLQNKVLRTAAYFPRCTPVRDLRFPYVHNYITKLGRQAEVTQNHENEHVRNI
jgi:hypothetical protein